MFAARRLTTALPRAGAQRALFHNTRAAFVKAGDPLPDLDVLVEGSPGNKVNLAKEFQGKKGVIVGTPAAFSTLSHHEEFPVCRVLFVSGKRSHTANSGNRKASREDLINRSFDQLYIYK